MLRSFFNSETGIWRFFGWVGDIVMLSLLWVLCSVPVLTLGAASTALYDTIVHGMRRRESNMFSRYFGTFRRELKTGCLTSLFWEVCALFLFYLYSALAGTGPDGQIAVVYSAIFLMILCFMLGILCWVFPLLSRFTFRFSDLNRTALRISLGNILRSAAMALLAVSAIALFLRNYFSVFFTPGLVSWLCSYLIEPVFQSYESKTSL